MKPLLKYQYLYHLIENGQNDPKMKLNIKKIERGKGFVRNRTRNPWHYFFSQTIAAGSIGALRKEYKASSKLIMVKL